MRRSKVALGIQLSLLLLLLAIGVGITGGPARPDLPDHVPGEVLIRFNSDADSSDVAIVRGVLGAEDLHRFASGGLHWRLGPGTSVEQAIARFENHPLIRHIEPNYIVSTNVVPNDPRFDELYGLLNTGQTGGTADADIDADMAWNVSTGSSDVLVGVIDTGIDYNHPDLAANVWTNPGEIPGNGVDDDGNGYVDDVHGYDFINDDGDPFDDHGHGTHCSGTIGGIGDNGIGVAGVNWHVKIVALKFLSASGSGSTADAVLATDYATMMGVKLTSNSWGGGGFSQELYDAIARANAADIAFVAAAGNGYGQNTDTTPHYPSSYDLPNIISVAATDHNDQLADFSNIGPTTVDLAAPGDEILSTLPGNSYGLLSGTSMATPHTAGVAALIYSVNPNVPMAQMKSVLMNATDPLPALAGKCVSEGRLNAFFAIAEPDTDPPGMIDDLATTEATSNTMYLGWTATGDDGDVGTASYYEVRWSTVPIDDTNWDAATRAGNEPAPEISGTPQTMEVRGLTADTLYYFGIKAFDEWGNAGPLSNLASEYTLLPPSGNVAPTSIFDELLTGEVADHFVTLTNTASGTLDFSIPAPILNEPYGLPAEPLDLGKDEADPRQGDAVIAGQGGPDPFGYRWIDSDEAGGPSFGWIDISSTGTDLGLTGDDQTSAPVDLGFSMPFYGTQFDSIRVCTNGWLSFTSSATAYGNQPLPTSGAPENLVAPFWDDLHPRTAGKIYFQQNGNQAIVQWTNIERYSGTGTYTFQAILDASGAVTLQYLSMTGDLTSSTVGIQDASKTVGLQVAFNQAYLHDDLAVRINSIPQWLSSTPTSGRLGAGESTDIRLRMDASGLEGGNYPGTVNILTNDPVNPTLTVDVTLHVIGAPDAEVQPESLDYGETFLGLPGTQTLLVVNNGTDSLLVSDIAPSDPTLDPQPRSFSVAPHSSQEVVVTWTPDLLGPFAGDVTVFSNDAAEPAIVVPCTGDAIPAPVMIVTPSALSETLYTGNATTVPLTVRNTGGSDLILTAAADLGDGILRVSSEESAEGAGGPDEFGYRWTDSDEPGGPAYDFVDISTSGEIVIDSGVDDRLSSAVDMGMTIPFYGNNFTQFKVSTNGWLTFSTSETSNRLTNSTLPSSSGAANMVCPFWDDLHTRSGDIRWQNVGDRVIVQWTNVEKYSPSGNPITFQAQLFPSGKVLLMYETMAGTLNSATIGIQDETKTIGLPVAYNTDYVHSAMAISISRTPDWLSVTPPEAIVPPGGSHNFDVTFDSTDQLAGVLQGAVVFQTNIPSQEEVRIPASLTVIGAPIAAVIPEAYDYGSRFTGYSYLTQFRIVNNGTDVLNVAEVFADHPTLTVFEDLGSGDEQIPEAEFALPPGGSRLFRLQWSPVIPFTLNAAVHVISGDPQNPDLVMPVTGVAIIPPVAGWTPSSFTEDLMVGDVVTRTMQITNGGGSDLTFNSLVSLDTGAIVSVDASPELKKGEPDDRPGVLGAGGPDVFGYVWRDSDEPGGPTFDWVDIGAVGTTISFASSDDSNFGPIPIGFSFPMYEQSFDTVRVCTNGFLTFTDTSTSLTNYLLPSTSAPRNLLSVFHDDLHLRDGNVKYYNDGSRFIVQYTDVEQYSPSTELYTFQVILYPNGRIVYQYLSMTTGDLLSATVGIQNDARDDGLTAAYNTAYIHDALAVEFRAPAGWLAVTPESGTVPPGGSVSLSVRFDTTDLIGGDYAASIDLSTNDPANGEIRVPVALHTTGIPDIDATPASLSFPMTYIGFERTDTVTIRNVGTDVLRITDVLVTGDFSQAGLTPPVDLAVGAELPVTVTFRPTTDGTLYGTLEVTSDDPDETSFVVALDGYALIPPEIVVDPTEISTALPPGGTRTKTVTITNTGGSDLTWNGATSILSDGVETIQGSYLDLGKEDIDPRAGILGSGGPDLYGYSWKDSDEPGGPVYDWVDIRGIGTRIADFGTYRDDGNVGPYPIGFQFNHYGNDFSDFRICSNGWVSFTSTLTTYSNQPLPNAASAVPENLLAPFWDDMVYDESDGSEIWYHYDGTKTVIQFESIRRIAQGSGPYYSFQIILYPNGTIRYQYQTLGATTDSATIGMQNATKDDGLTVVFNDTYVHENLAIEFSRFPEWVTIDPTTGTIPAGGSQEIEVTLDSAGLEDGIHEAVLSFTSNDPYTPQVDVPVTLNVSLVPATWATFSPDVLNLSSNGNFVKMTIQLPEELDPYAIRLSSVLLQDAVPALAHPAPSYGDSNGDGITEVSFKFDRQAVEALLPVGQEVPIYIQGEVEDVQWWRGMDTIRTMHPRVTAPNGADYIHSGQLTTITWEPPLGGNIHHYEVHLSRDGGVTFEMLDDNVRSTSLDWTVTEPLTGAALVRVVALDSNDVLGYDYSDGTFVIATPTLQPPHPVGDTVAIDLDGAGNLALGWKAPAVDPNHGPADRFRILRAESPAGPFTEVGEVTGTEYIEPVEATQSTSAVYYRVEAANAAGSAE